jgi:hypothetical protein
VSTKTIYRWIETWKISMEDMPDWRGKRLGKGGWTDSFAEGVNNKIKLIKRRAFGFTNFNHLRLLILVKYVPNPT